MPRDICQLRINRFQFLDQFGDYNRTQGDLSQNSSIHGFYRPCNGSVRQCGRGVQRSKRGCGSKGEVTWLNSLSFLALSLSLILAYLQHIYGNPSQSWKILTNLIKSRVSFSLPSTRHISINLPIWILFYLLYLIY